MMGVRIFKFSNFQILKLPKKISPPVETAGLNVMVLIKNFELFEMNCVGRSCLSHRFCFYFFWLYIFLAYRLITHLSKSRSND